MKRTILLKSLLLLCALIAGSAGVWADETPGSATLTWSEQNLSNATSVDGTSYNVGDYFTVTCTKNSASTAPTYYSSGTAVRCYVTKNTSNGNIITVARKAGVEDVYITKVTYDGTHSKAGTTSFTYSGTPTTTTTTSATYNSSDKVTSATATLCETGNSKNGQFYFTSITVEYVIVSSASSTYNVTYDANGADAGSVPTDDTDYLRDATVTVLGNTGSLTKAHYTFGGWNTKTDGTGTTYSAAATFTITMNTTLYAKWDANTHDIIVPATDTYGTYTASATNDVAYGTEVTLTYTPAVGYESYTATWSVNGVEIDGNAFEMPDEDVTVTVTLQLDPKQYTTLTSTDISGMTNAKTGYGTEKTLIKDGLLWTTNGWQDNSYYSMIQLRVRTHSNGVSYIKLPVFSGEIQTITFSMTSASGTSKGADKTATVLYFQTGNTSGETVVASTTSESASEKTIDLSALGTKYSTGYITASAGARIWDITVAYIPTDFAVSVGDVKYATFSDHLSRDFSGTGITPYTAKVDEDKVVLTKVADGIVPANTGVILYSESGAVDKNIPFTKAAATTDFSENELVGVNVDTTVKYNPESGVYNYILQKSGSSIVFNKATSTGAKLRAHRAYLSTTYNVASAPALEVVIGGENGDDNTTGISEKVTVDSSEASAPVYNLNGQRVSQPTKGLYIVNGKKVILK